MNFARLLAATSIIQATFAVGHPSGADPSDATESSYAAPVRGDVIEWISPHPSTLQAVTFEEGSAVLRASARALLATSFARFGSTVHAEVTGRPDASSKAALGAVRGQAIRRALMAVGMPSDRILIVAESDGESRVEAMRSSDSTVRWIPAAPGSASIRSPGVGSPVPPVVALPAASASSTPAAPAILSWDVQTQDITLERTLTRWAAAAGYRLRWDADRNFLIAASDRYEGAFEVALQAVLGSAGIRQSDYPLEACIYGNRPPLVRITRLGEQARECESP